MRRIVGICLGFIVSFTAACGGGGGGGSPPPPSPPPPPANVTIGGTVQGLQAGSAGFTLQNGTGLPLAITGNGPFLFPGTVPNGTVYFVRVAAQPGAPTQFCSVPNGAGIATSNTAINVICNTGRARYVFVTDHAQNLLYGIDVDPGSLGAFDLSLVGPPVSTGQWPIGPAVVLAGSAASSGFVYVRNLLDGTVSAYSIAPGTGVPTAVPGSPFSITGQGNSIIQTVISPTGRFVYFLDQGAGGGTTQRIFAYLIQPNGALVAISGSPFNAVDTTHRLEIDPLGRYLYGATSSFAGAAVTTYRVDPGTGALSSVGTPAIGTFGLARGVVHPNGQNLYVARDTLGQPAAPAIDAYMIDTATGQLTLVESEPAASNNQSTIPIMDPQGRFLYVTGAAGVVGFRVNVSTGALTPVGSPPVLVGVSTGQIDIDPTGRYLYAPIDTATSDGVAAFTIDQTTGQLTVIPGTPFPLGLGTTPTFLKADASGSLLFVATFGNHVITALTILADGSLSFLDSETGGLNVTHFALAGTQ